MPLSYLKTGYTEPSASAGSDVQVSQAGLARPVLNHTGGTRKHRGTRKHKSCKCKKGGFYPTVMGSFLRNASRLVPAVVYSGYKLMNKTRKSRK
jgi:hypothetical protein